MEVVNRLLGWKRGERAGPIKLHLVMTERCNLRCLSCFMGQIPQSASKYEVSDDRLRSLAHEAMDMGVQEFYMVGGEVFIRKAVTLDLMELIKREGLFGDLTTNGTLLAERTVDRIVGMGWDRLQVSIDGPDAETNDALRPPAGTFDRIVKGLTRLRDAKVRLGVETPRLTITTVLSNRNALKLPQFVALAGELDAAEITFQSLKAMSDKVPDLELSEDDKLKLQPAVEEAQRLAGRLGLYNNVGDFRQAPVVEHLGALDQTMVEDIHDVQDPFFGAHCFTPWTQMVVHVNGRVSPCWEWDAPDLGNVSDMTLAEIWEGPVFERWREQFAARKVPGFCSQCCLGFVDYTRYLRMKGLSLNGQYDEALTIADKILVHDPHHRDAVDTRARALYALGRYEEGAAMIEQVVEDAPSGSGLLPSYLLHLLVDTERPDLALEAAGRLLDGAKNNSPALRIFASLTLGEEVDATPLREGEIKLGEQRPTATALAKAYVSALYDIGRPEDARRVIRGVIGGLAGRDLTALCELIFVAHMRKEWAFVIELATEVLRREPDQAYALWIRGAAKGKQGDLQGALADLDACVAAPGHLRSHFNDAVHDSLAEVHLATGNIEECLRHAEEALAMDPDKLQCLEFKVHALFELGRDDEAESWIRTILDTAPEHHLVGQGYLLLRLSERGSAEAVVELGTSLLERVSALDEDGAVPQVARAVLGEPRRDRGSGSLGQHGASIRGLLQALARAHYRLGHDDDARRIVVRALDALEGSDLEVLSELIFEPHLAGEWTTAANLAGDLLQRQPDLVYARWIRGAARGKLGELDAATVDLEACLEAPSGWLSRYADAVHDSLAEVHLQRGAPEEALRHAEEALRLSPERAGCLAIKDQALTALGRSEEGDAWIHTALTESSPRTALGHAYLLLRLCERGEYGVVDELAAALLQRLAGGGAGPGVTGLVRVVLGESDRVDEALGSQAASMRGLLQSLIRAHYGQDRGDAARALANRVLAGVDGPDLDVLSELIFEPHLADDWPTAVDLATGALERKSTLFYARWVRGAALGKLGELDAALADLQACTAAPADWLARFADAVHDSLAEVYLQRGDPELALEHAEEALRLAPERTTCLAIKDQALLALGRSDEGEEWIRTVLTESSPQSALGHAYLLLRLCERGEYEVVDELAAALLERIADGNAGPGLANLVGVIRGDGGPSIAPLGAHAASTRGLMQALMRAHHGQGRGDEAVELARRVLSAVDAADLDVLGELIFEHHLASEWAVAVELAGEVLQRRPGLFYARWVRGAALGKLGEADGALEDLRACLDAPTEWKTRFADAVHDSLAEVYLQYDEPELALEHAEEALRLAPERTTCLAIKDQALLALGRSDEGEEWIRTVLTESSPRSALGHAYLLLRLCEREEYPLVDELGAALLDRIAGGGAGSAVASLVRVVRGDDEPATEALGSQAASMRGLLQALVRAHYGRGRGDEARALCRRVLEAVDGPDLEVLCELTFEPHLADDWAEAVELTGDVLRHHPELVYPRWVRGAAQGKLDETDLALEDLRTCLDAPAERLAPFADAVHDSLAEVHLQRREPDEALRHAREALKHDPGKTQSQTLEMLALQHQAYRAQSRGESDEALQLVAAIEDIDPERATKLRIQVLLDLGFEAHARGETDEALHLAEEVLALEPQDAKGNELRGLALITLGYHAHDRGEVEQALRLATEASDILPRRARELAVQVQLAMGFEAHAAGDADAALQQAERILEQSPGHPEALGLKASALMATGYQAHARGEIQEALRRADEVQEIEGGRGQDLKLEALYALAAEHLRRGDAEQALEQANAALALAPDRPHVLDLRDRALLALQTLDEGEAGVREVLLETSPRFGLGQAHLLLKLVERGRHRVAVDLGEQLLGRISGGDAGPAAQHVARAVLDAGGTGSGPALGDLGPAARSLLQALSRARFQLGHRRKAVAVIRRALAAASDQDLEVLSELIFEPHLADEWALAEELASALLVRRSDLAYARWVRGAARGKLDELDGALEDLRACLDADPRWLARFADAVHDSLAEVHLQRSEPALALEHADEALKLNPGKAQSRELKALALQHLSYAAQTRGEADEALKLAEAVKDLDPGRSAALKLQVRIDAGFEAHARGETDGALRLAEEVLAQEPDHPKGLELKGLALIALGYRAHDRDEAEEALRRAEEAAPIDPVRSRELAIQVQLAVGFAAHARGDSDRALEQAEEVLRLDPDHPEALGLKAAALMAAGYRAHARGNLREALRRADEVLEIDRVRGQDLKIEALCALATENLQRGDAEQALEHARAALVLAPDRPHVLNLRDRALLALQHLDQGEAGVREVLLGTSPRFALGQAHLLLALCERGRHRTALELGGGLLERIGRDDAGSAAGRVVRAILTGEASRGTEPLGTQGPPLRSLVQALARARYGLGHKRKARDLVRRALDAAGDDDLETLSPLIFEPHLADEWATAVQLAGEVLRRCPELAYARWVRGAAHGKLGDLDSALEDLLACLDAPPEQLAPFADAVHDSLAEVHLQRGEPERALKHAGEALAIDPDKTQSRNLKVLALQHMTYGAQTRGEADEALRLTAAIEDLDHTRAAELRLQVWLDLGFAAHARGESGEALRLAEEVLGVEPDHPKGVELKGLALIAQGYGAHDRGDPDGALRLAAAAASLDPVRSQELAVQVQLAMGFEAHAAGDADTALQQAESILQQSPDHPEALGLKAAALMATGYQAHARGELSEALRRADEVQEIDRGRGQDLKLEALYALAAEHLRQGDADLALEQASAALALAPDRPHVQDLRDRALLARRNLDEGEAGVREVLLETSPRFGLGQAHLLLNLVERGRHRVAVDLGERLLERISGGDAGTAAQHVARAVLDAEETTPGPSLGDLVAAARSLLQALSRARFGLGHRRKAVAIIQRALAAAADQDLEVLSELIFEPHLAGEWALAEELASQVLVRRSDLAYARWIRGAARGKLDELDGALEDLRACLDADPRWLARFADAVHDSLAEVHLQRSEPDLALEHADEALKLNPGKTQSRELKAMALQHLTYRAQTRGEADEALEFAEAVEDLDPGRSAALKLQVRIDAGFEAHARGETDGALRLAEEVLAQEPDHPKGLELMGLAVIAQGYRAHDRGEAEEALRMAEKAATIDPVRSRELAIQVQLAMGFEAHARGDSDRALEQAEEVLRLDPEAPEALGLKAAALMASGYQAHDRGENREALQRADEVLQIDRNRGRDLKLEALCALATDHLQQGDAEQALDLATIALEIAPDRPHVCDLRDRALLALWHLDEGEAGVREVLLETSLRFALGQAHLLLRLVERGRHRVAVDLGERLLERIAGGDAGTAAQHVARAALDAEEATPGPSLGDLAAAARSLLQALARARFGLGHRRKAVAVIRCALAAAADQDLEVLSELIFEPHLAGEWALAEELASQVLVRRSDLAYARWIRGAARGKLDELDGALEDLRACLDADPRWLARFADAVHDSLAEVHLQRSEPDLALEHADEALKLNPGKTQSRELKAMALQHLTYRAQTRGEADEALEFAEAVEDLDPGRSAALKLQVRIDAGFEAHARGETDGALRLAEEVLAQEPDHPKGLELKGLALIALGYRAHDRDEAEEALRRAEEAAPIDPVRSRELAIQVQLAIGFAAHARGDFDQALEQAEEVLRLDPEAPEALGLKAAALMATGYRAHAQGEDREALQRADEVLEIDPHRGRDLKLEALCALATDHLQQGDAEQALDLATIALEITPDRPHVRDLRDRALLALRRLDEGEAGVREVLLETSPRFALGQAHLLLELCERGRHRAAVDLGGRLLERISGGGAGPAAQHVARAVLDDGEAAPGPALGDLGAAARSLLQALARAHFGLGHRRKAVTMIQRALAAAADQDLEVLSELIFEPHLADEWAHAEAIASEVLARRPDLAYARWIRGAARGKLDELDGALEDLRACLDADPRWLARFADAVHDSLAEVHLQRSEPDQALEHADEALRLVPGKIQSRELKAVALQHLTYRAQIRGEADEALRLAEAVEDLDPGRSAALKLQVRIDAGFEAHARGETDEALRLSEEVLAQEPDHPKGLELKGLALLALGYRAHDQDEAEEALRRAEEAAPIDPVRARELAIQVQLAIGFEAHARGDSDRARQQAEEVLRLDPDAPEALGLKAAALVATGYRAHARGDLSEALQRADEVLEIDPHRGRDLKLEALCALATDHLQQGDAEQALDLATIALEITPDRPHVRDLRDRALLALRRLDEGEAGVREVLLETSPRFALGQAHLLLELCERGRHRAAVDLGGRLLERISGGGAGPAAQHVARAVLDDGEAAPGPALGDLGAAARSLLQALARAHFGLGHRRKAVTMIQRALAAAADQDLEVLSELIFEPHLADEWAHAEAIASEVLARRPDLAYARWIRGAARGKLDELDGALEDLRACLDADPRWLARFADAVHDSLAEVHLQRSEPDQALEHADEALRLVPGKIQSRELKAVALQHLTYRAQIRGEADEALKLAAAVEDLDPGRSAALKLQVRIDAGFEAHARGETDEALRLSEEVLAQEPDHPKGLELKGLALIALGYRAHDRDEAEEALRRAEEAAPIDPVRSRELAIQVQLAVGFAAHARGDSDRALEQAEEVLRLDPEHPEALGLKVAALMATGYRAHARGDLREALQRADEVLEIDPERGRDLEIEALCAMAAELLQQGDAEEALEGANRALVLAPDRPHLVNLRDRALLALRHLDQGEAGVREVLLGTSPRFALGQAHLLLKLCERGRHRAALELGEGLAARIAGDDAGSAAGLVVHTILTGEATRAAEPLGEQGPALRSLVQALVRARFGLGHRRKAATIIQRALAAATDQDLVVLSELVFEPHLADQWATAVELATEVLRRRPELAYARWVRGAAQGKLGDLDAAREDLRECLDAPPEQLAPFADAVHDSLAEVHLLRDEHAEALAHAELALEIDPSKAQSRNLKVLALQHLTYRAQTRGEADEALRLTAAIEDLDHDRAAELRLQVWLDLGFAAHARGEPDEALRLAEEALILETGHPKGLELKALALIAQGYGAHDRSDANAALQLAGRAAEIDPERARELTIQVLLAIGFEAHDREDAATALRQAEEVLQIAPDHPEALGLKAAALMATGYRAHARGENREALQRADEVLEIDRERGRDLKLEALYALAAEHLQQGDADRALDLATVALDIAPDRPHVRDLRDRAVLALRHLDQGEAGVREVLLETSPRFALGQAHLLLKLCDRGRHRTAARLGDELLERISGGDAGPAAQHVARAVLVAGETAPGPALGDLGPATASLLQALARARFGLGHRRKAVTIIRRALAAAADQDLEVLSELIFEPHLAGEWALAEELASQVLVRRSDLAYARWIRGAARGKLDELDGALEDLRACLDADPRWLARFADAVHDSLAEVHLQRSEPDLALEHADEALKLNPGKTQSRELKAMALQHLTYRAQTRGEADEALEFAEAVEDLDPGRSAALKLQVRIDAGFEAHARGETDEALRLAEEVLAQERDHPKGLELKGLALIALGYQAHDRDEADEALRLAGEAATIDPVRSRELAIQVQLAIGFAAHSRGDSDRALVQAEEVLRLDPGQPEALGLKATALMATGYLAHARGESDDALQRAEQVLAIDDDRGRGLKIQALYTLATEHLDRGEAQQAVERMDAALAMDPELAHCRDLRDRALLAVERLDEGEAGIRTVLTQTSPRFALGQAHLLLGLCERQRHRTALELGEALLERLAEGGAGPQVRRLTRGLRDGPVATDPVDLGDQRPAVRSLLQALARARYGLGHKRKARELIHRSLRAVTGADLEELSELIFEPHLADEWTVAVDLASDVLQRRPDSTYARWVRGAARTKLGDFDGSLDDLLACLDMPREVLAPFADAVHDSLAEVYLRREESAAALEHADEALALNPGKTQSLGLRKLALEQLTYKALDIGDMDEALRRADAVEEIDPQLAGALKTQTWLDDGFLALGRGETDHALHRARDVLALNPENPKGIRLRDRALREGDAATSTRPPRRER